jgi:uncharacterized protein (DUF302 family)
MQAEKNTPSTSGLSTAMSSRSAQPRGRCAGDAAELPYWRIFMSTQTVPPPGVIVIASHHPVDRTVDRLESLLKEKEVLVFARIDLSGDAARVGLHMRAEQLLIFGNPKGGTPLMQAMPTVGLDLPLKALVWEDSEDKTWLAYNDPMYIVQRHAVQSGLSAILAAVIPLLERAAAQ